MNKGYAWLERNPVTGLFVAGGLGGLAVLGVVGTVIYSQETFVAKSACTRDPSSAACAQVREEIARAEPIRNPCIGFQRVTRTRGRACPKDYIDLRRKRQLQTNSKELQNLEHTGFGSSNKGPVRTPKSSTGGAGHGKGTSGGTHGGPKSPPKAQEPSASAESPPSSPDARPVTPTPESASPAPAPSDEPGSVQSTLEQAGETLHSTVCSTAELLIHPNC